MNNEPVYGCAGCSGTAGAWGCPTHGNQTFTIPGTRAGKALHRGEIFDLASEEDRRRLAVAIESEATEPRPMTLYPEKCASCAGTGEVVTDSGFGTCPDCNGLGTEWPTPTTKQGRVLIDDLKRLVGPNEWTGFREEQIAIRIRAIEAEAAALAARPAEEEK